MKFVAIVGTNADFSYNRVLLQFMKKHFWRMAEIEIAEIKDLPAFSKDVPFEETTPVWKLKQQINAADGVIFSTPEYDHAVPAAMKSAVEWLSYQSKVLHGKPAMIVGVSYGRQASARAQQQMRKMLLSPDCNANLLSGNEVLIGNAAKVFSKDGRLTDQACVDNLEKCFTNFVEYAELFKNASRGEQLMSVKRPMIEDAYVSFPTGRLSLREVQAIFNTIPFEIDLIDADDRFAYYSDKPNREHVRNVNQLGETYSECHPPKAVPAVKAIIDSFKNGTKDVVARPLMMNGHRVLIRYYALRDVDGHYLGTIEFTGSVDDILKLAENGAWNADATSSASHGHAAPAPVEEPAPAMDATTGASEDTDEEPAAPSEPAAPVMSAAVQRAEQAETDASTGASEVADDPEETDADAMTGASEN